MTAIAGLRATHRSFQTGRVVSLYDGEAAGMDTTAGRWQTVCEDHGTVISHRTLTVAEYQRADPLGWCEQCREEADDV